LKERNKQRKTRELKAQAKDNLRQKQRISNMRLDRTAGKSPRRPVRLMALVQNQRRRCCQRSCWNQGVGGVISIAEKAEQASLSPRQRLRLGVQLYSSESTKA